MKQLILILLLFIGVSTTSFAQKDSTEYVTNTATEKLIDKYADKIEAGIASLAKSLKQPAEHVYKVLVKQQTVNAWSWMTLIILFFVATTLLWVFWIKDKKNKNDWWGVPVIITIILAVLAAMLLPTVLSGFINPEYGAIKEIIEFIK